MLITGGYLIADAGVGIGQRMRIGPAVGTRHCVAESQVALDHVNSCSTNAALWLLHPMGMIGVVLV